MFPLCNHDSMGRVPYLTRYLWRNLLVFWNAEMNANFGCIRLADSGLCRHYKSEMTDPKRLVYTQVLAKDFFFAKIFCRPKSIPSEHIRTEVWRSCTNFNVKKCVLEATIKFLWNSEAFAKLDVHLHTSAIKIAVSSLSVTRNPIYEKTTGNSEYGHKSGNVNKIERKKKLLWRSAGNPTNPSHPQMFGECPTTRTSQRGIS